MGISKDLGHLAHIVKYDTNNNITIPAGLKINGTNDVVTTNRNLTINGVTYDLSTDRSWSISAFAGYTSLVQQEVRAAEAITKGQAVYVSGANGSNMLVSKASNVSEGLSSKTLGLVDASVAANGLVNVITEGVLTGLNTLSATIGDPVWLGTGGNLLYGIANKPLAPANLVFIGFVTRVNANNGEIFVKVQNGFELGELHNVAAPNGSSNNNDGLFWESSTQLWKNKSIGTVLGYTPVPDTRTLTINGTTYDLTADRSWTISGGVPYTGATADVNLGTYAITGGIGTFTKGYINGIDIVPGHLHLKKSTYLPVNSIFQSVPGYNSITSHGYSFIFLSDVDGTNRKFANFNLNSLTNNTNRTYYLPDSSGTLALTSDIPSTSSFVPYQGATGLLQLDSYGLSSAGITLLQSSSIAPNTGYTSINGILNGIDIRPNGSDIFQITFPIGSSYNYSLPNASGTLALTSDLSSYVLSSTSITINGVTQDLMANRAWTVSGGVPYSGATGSVDLGAYDLTVNGLLIGKMNGFYNTRLGVDTLIANLTSGSSNTAIGYQVLKANTDGDYNTAVGTMALSKNTTGSSNNAFGYQALFNNSTGIQNTAFGHSSLSANTNSYNTAFGGLSLASNTSGSRNTALGYNALLANTLGGFNTAVGQGAGSSLSSGNYNVFIGGYSGVGTSSNNIFLSDGEGNLKYHWDGSNNKFTGNVNPSADNTYSLGISGTRWTAIWAVNGTIQTSDEREKKDIVDSDLGLDFISKLRPVSFKWKVGQNIITKESDGLDESGMEKFREIVTSREGIRTHYGLIAQEVEALLDGKDFGGFIHDSETDTKGLRYDQFVPLLIKSIQELKSEIDILKNV